MSNAPTPEQAGCPSTKQLLDWLNGDLELPPLVQQHLRVCQRCSKLLESLSDDGELQSLATISLLKPDRNHQHEAEFLELRQRLNQWSLNDLPDTQTKSSAVDSASSKPFSTEHADLAETDQEPTTLDMPTVESLRARLPVGRFSVDRLIAKGGSGAVYLAYDQQLKREVAIKVLGRNSMRDRQRFMREARILAELEHANIVRLFDFGKLSPTIKNSSESESSHSVEQLYLVMEYISGGTAGNLRVDQPCWQDFSSQARPFQSPEKQNESLPSVSRAGRMDFRRLAKLLATAADGLAAAHAKNLVHRDVKPGNLMLTLDWSAIKVADFGLAKVSEIDSTQVTRTGDLLGTPVFMSPEQVTGHDHLTAASDIYSLGATLYQLLTGEAPFQGSSTAVLRQIIEVAPVAPRVLNPHIPMELEVICSHAMEKDAAARYASMTQFADDLRRFSIGEPIHARPVSSTTKAIRFLKKNRPFAAALLASTVLLLTLTLGSIAAAIVFRNQNTQLSLSAEAESKAKIAAQNSLRDAIEAADELLVSVTEDTELLPRTPGSEEIARKLLKKAQDYYQQLLAGGDDGNQLVLFDEARARSGLAQIANRLGNPSEVEQEAKAAIALLNKLPGDAISSPERTVLIAKTLGYLGKSLSTRGELKRAASVMNEAVTICEAELRQHDLPQTQKQQAVQAREVKFILGDSLRLLATAEHMAGELNKAEETSVKAETIFSELLENYPGDPVYLRMLAGCNSTRAVTLVRRDGYEAARGYLERAIELLSKLEVDGQLPVRIRPDRATNFVNLAMVEFNLGRTERAGELFKMAEGEYDQLSNLEPGVVDHKYKKVLTVLNSGKIDIALNNIDSILRRYRLLEPILADLLEVDPYSQEYLGTLGMVQGNMAVFLRMLDRPAEALENLKISNVTLRRYAQLIENTPDSLYAIAINQYELAKCNMSLNRIDDGVSAIRESMSISAELLKDHPDYLPSRMHQFDEWVVMCELLESREDSDPQQLMDAAQNGLEISKKLLADIPELPEYEVAQGVLYSSLSQANLRQKKIDQAIKAAKEGIEYLHELEADMEAKNVREAFLWNYISLAKALAAQSGSFSDQESTKRDEAINSFEESLEKCSEFGASEEELAKLRALIPVP